MFIEGPNRSSNNNSKTQFEEEKAEPDLMEIEEEVYHANTFTMKNNRIELPVPRNTDILKDDPDLILLNPKNNEQKPRKNPAVREGETECKYCGSIVAKVLIGEHLVADCINQRLPCEFCDVPIHRGSYQQHSKECNHNPNKKKKKKYSNDGMIPCE